MISSNKYDSDIMYSFGIFLKRTGVEFIVAVALGWIVQLIYSLSLYPHFGAIVRSFCALWFSAGASFYIGAIAGFMFGLPRHNQKTNLGTNDGTYGDNTNLNEISDWLVKIIVGASLVEMRNVANGIWKISVYIGKFIATPGADIVAAGGIVYGFICGFIAYYVWTRLRIKNEFEMAASKAGNSATAVVTP